MVAKSIDAEDRYRKLISQVEKNRKMISRVAKDTAVAKGIEGAVEEVIDLCALNMLASGLERKGQIADVRGRDVLQIEAMCKAVESIRRLSSGRAEKKP